MGSTPITARCPKCVKYEDFRTSSRPSREGLVATGRTKTKARLRGNYNVPMAEVRHERCGHVFWTSHPDFTRHLGGKRRHGA